MSIDFHAASNAQTYTGRTAHETWRRAMTALRCPSGLDIVDIGCGGGTYALAWAELGGATVTAVDFSRTMLADAAATTAGQSNVNLRHGTAERTGLADQTADIVFARALIHHLGDLAPFLHEALRILRPGGLIVLQDRTPEDAALPGSEQHLRGYILEAIPRLRDIEAARRHGSGLVTAALATAGFEGIDAQPLWETRRRHSGRAALLDELRARRGRSLLHEVNEAELERLVAHMEARLPERGAITEADRWTIWSGRKPGRPSVGREAGPDRG